MDTGRVIQEVTQRKAQHESRAQQLKNQILLLEQNLETLTDTYQQHLGAVGACDFFLQTVHDNMQGPPDAPSNDPNAESDQ